MPIKKVDTIVTKKSGIFTVAEVSKLSTRLAVEISLAPPSKKMDHVIVINLKDVSVDEITAILLNIDVSVEKVNSREEWPF